MFSSLGLGCRPKNSKHFFCTSVLNQGLFLLKVAEFLILNSFLNWPLVFRDIRWKRISALTLFTLLRIQVSWVGRFLIFPSAVFCLRYSRWQQSLGSLTYSWHFLSLHMKEWASLGDAQAAALSLVLVLDGKFISSPSPACGRLGAGASQADGTGGTAEIGFPGNKVLWEILVGFWTLGFEVKFLLLYLALKTEPEQWDHHINTGKSSECSAITPGTLCGGSISSQTHPNTGHKQRGTEERSRFESLVLLVTKSSLCFPVLPSQRQHHGGAELAVSSLPKSSLVSTGFVCVSSPRQHQPGGSLTFWGCTGGHCCAKERDLMSSSGSEGPR